MRLWTAPIPPPLDTTLKSLPLRDTGNPHFLSRLKEAYGQNLTDGILLVLRGLQTELPEMLLRSHLGLVEVALERLGDLSGLALRLIADLDRLVAVSIDGHPLHYWTGPRFDDGHRDGVSTLVKHLRHSNLFTKQSNTHIKYPLALSRQLSAKS